jgi:2-polyprenyl-3-methyl-5-hydroxy-6-metoxy-1,4-benzoquinol methylase
MRRVSGAIALSLASQDGDGRARVTGAHDLLALQRVLYESRNPTRRWLHRTRRDWISGALERLASLGSRAHALEVGPGSGVYVPILSRLFERVTVLDIESAYLDAVRELALPNVSVVCDDIRRPTAPAARVDLLLCTEVIEHIGESRAALAGMRRLLRPGGVLVLSTPQRYSPLEVCSRVAFLPGVIDVVRLIYREPILPTGHINLLTAAEARRQIEQAGFMIRQTHTSGIYLPLLAELGGEPVRRLAEWLEGRLRGGRLAWLLWTQYYVAEAT